MSLGDYTGTAIVDWILALAGNVIIAVLAVGFVSALAKSEWGKMVGLFAGAVIATLFVWFPDTGVGLLKAIVSAFQS